MFANPKKYNPALLDRVAGSLKGSTMYAYQTQFTLDHILGDDRFFLDSNGNFGAGDTITINRYDDSGPLPVHTHTLLERIVCIVKQSDRQGVHIRPLPDQYLDMEAFEAEWQAEKAGVVATPEVVAEAIRRGPGRPKKAA